MRIKNTLSIAAFTSAFIASTAFAGLFVVKTTKPSLVVSPSYSSEVHVNGCFRRNNNATSAQKISAFVRQDIANGDERSRELRAIDGHYVLPFSSLSFEEYSAVTAEYADRSGSMKDDGLPSEFQIAWRDHMKAWRDYADFLEGMEDSSARADLGKESFNALDRAYDREISRTWFEVLRVAEKNGAVVR